MNANRHFEEDDLAFYAMGLLAEPEASAVARHLAESEETRAQLAEVRAQLAAFAQTAVVLEPVPEGSLERLMGRIAQEPRIGQEQRIGQEPRIGQEQRSAAGPIAVPAIAGAAGRVGSERAAASGRAPVGDAAAGDADVREGVPGRRGFGVVLPWLGWAVAAGLAVTAGRFYQDRTALDRSLTAQTGQVAQMSADTRDVSRRRETLEASVAEQASRIQQLTAEATGARGENKGLRSAAAEQTRAAAEQAMAAAEQARRLAQETARLDAVTAQQATAEQERDALQQRVAAQSSQMAQLTNEAARAREVLEALNDRTALRVTLTEPKTQAAPTGRATYVASRGTLVFLASNLAPLRENKVYQLWLMPANGAGPVPLGTFAPDAQGSASLVYPREASAIPAKGFAVTIENTGGAQTPTLPIILAGVSGA